MASYNSIIRLEADPDFRERLRVAAALAGIPDPHSWVAMNALKIALLEEINSKYEQCLKASPYHSRPGYDPEVISDKALADAVRKVLESDRGK